VWLLRIILFVALLVFFVALATQNNADPGVDVKLFFWEVVGVKLWWVIFVSALMGFAVGILVSVVREIRLRMDVSRARRDRAQLQKEIDHLRAAPLEEIGPTSRKEPPHLDTP
jgi:uncharacterized integral membrane protein